MTQQRDIHKIQLLIFMQRLYAHLLILKYFELLSKRNSSGNKTTLLYPNGIQTTYTYDAKGDLIDIITQKAPSTGSGQATSTYKQTYQYDKTGNRTSYTEPSGIHTYTYDPTYQLLSADHTNMPDENYTYDQTGNRLNTQVDAANRLTEDATYTYQYDNNGNLIRKTHKITGIITQYTYDFENRLIKINLPLGITAEYKYDPFGRRIEKNISGQITTKYLYDNEDIIMEYAAIIPTNTNITTKYIHGPGIDEPLSMIRNNLSAVPAQAGKTYYYHADALESITRMTDQNGNTVQTIRYDTFGNIKSIKNPLLIQPYAYTGREYDIESGFYYLRNRYYDPRIGRFISKDPIGFAGGDVNLFRYVGNNAVNYTDPYGLQERPPVYPTRPVIPIPPGQTYQMCINNAYIDYLVCTGLGVRERKCSLGSDKSSDCKQKLIQDLKVCENIKPGPIPPPPFDIKDVPRPPF